MVTYEKIATPDPAPTMSPERQLIATGTPPVCYSITDRVHALPVGLWDSDVVSTYEFIDVERGVFVRLRSPLSVTMETVWTVREVEGSSGESEGETQHELVEDIVISCSRLLMGTVKGTCESGWKEIHEKMMGHLKEQSAAQ